MNLPYYRLLTELVVDVHGQRVFSVVADLHLLEYALVYFATVAEVVSLAYCEAHAGGELLLGKLVEDALVFIQRMLVVVDVVLRTSNAVVDVDAFIRVVEVFLIPPHRNTI